MIRTANFCWLYLPICRYSTETEKLREGIRCVVSVFDCEAEQHCHHFRIYTECCSIQYTSKCRNTAIQNCICAHQWANEPMIIPAAHEYNAQKNKNKIKTKEMKAERRRSRKKIKTNARIGNQIETSPSVGRSAGANKLWMIVSGLGWNALQDCAQLMPVRRVISAIALDLLHRRNKKNSVAFNRPRNETKNQSHWALFSAKHYTVNVCRPIVGLRTANFAPFTPQHKMMH